MAAKSAPFSMRLSKNMETLVALEATRTGRSKGAIVEALAEEALRMRLFPGIAFRGTDWDRRAWVIGTALDVWQIVDAYRDLGSVQDMVDGGSASERNVNLALAYCERFPEEIDTAIADNHSSIDRLRAEFPFVAVTEIDA
jgi:hypothetical protein